MAEENATRYSPSFGAGYNTLQEERRRDTLKSREDRLGAGELWDAVTESEWVVPRLEDRASRERGQAPAITPERLSKELGNKYSQQEYDFIAEAGSEADYQSRIAKVSQDRELAQKIGAEGLRGMGYSMVAGMVDPALLPLYIGTGGAGAVGRASLLARTLRSGAVGAAEGAAIESVLASGDTQRDWKDVVMAGVSSGIMTGGITMGVGGFQRVRKGSEPQPDLGRLDRDPLLSESAQAADASLTRMARDFKEEQAVRALEEAVEIRSLQSIDTRQAIVDELMPIAQSRLTRGERKPLEAEVRSLESQIAQLNANRSTITGPDAGGTARQRRAAAEAKQARVADIEARVRPLQERVDSLQRTLDEDLPAREAWADISRLAQGQIPERFRERMEAMQQDAMPPLRRQEGRAVREAAEALQARRTAEAEAAIRRPQGPEDAPDTGSVGAARVEGVRDAQDAYTEAGSLDVEEDLFRMSQVGESLPERDRLRRLAGGGIKRMSSAYSRLINSESNVIRGLAHTLLADPQVAARGHIAASHRVANIHDRLVAAEGGREAVARDLWAKEQGINPIRMHMLDGSVARDFDNLVVLQMRGQDQGSEAIKQAAEARQDMLREALKARKDAGEAGFENVEDNAAYWSFLPDFHKMHEAVARHGPEEVVELLTGAYMNGRFRLGESTARMVARATYSRTMRRGLSSEDASKYSLSKADIGALRADMEEAGVPTNQIDAFLDEIESLEAAQGLSNRSKMSLGASMSYSNGNLRMVDILDTSVNVTNKYAQEAAAGAALARSGFKSRGQAERAIDEAEITAKNALLDSTRGNNDPEANKRSAQISEEAQMLRDSIRMMYGESLEADIGKAVKLSRAARKVTNIIALQWNGFASVGEASNQIVNMGLATTMRNTRVRDFASFGKIRKSEDLQGMYKLVGAYGQFGASVKDNNYTLQTMDEYNQGKLERIFNNGAGWVSNKTQLMSGFRSVQNGLENIALRSMQDRMTRIADGKIKPTRRDFDEMERAGLRRDQIDEVLRHIRENPEYATVDGSRVRIFTGDGLEPSLREDLSTAMTVMLSRNMQRSFVGETPVWMSKELGKVLTQFRSFSIVSVEKQLAAGLRGDTIGMFLKTMWGIALGSMAYSSRAWIRAQNDEDPEEKFAQYTDPMTFATGVVNMTPHLGLVGMGMELGFATGLVDSEGSSMASRSGSRPLTPEGMVPSVGVAFDAVNAGRNLIKGIGSQDSELAMKSYQDALGMMPMLNTAAIGTAMAIANSAD